MEYKASLINILVDSDDLNRDTWIQSEDFVRYLIDKAENDYKIRFKCYKGSCFMDDGNFEDFNETMFNDSEFAIIIAYSEDSQTELFAFSKKLSLVLNNKSGFRNRFVFVTIGNVDLPYTLVVNPILNFSIAEWKYSDNDLWIELFDLIKESWIPYTDPKTEIINAINQRRETYLINVSTQGSIVDHDDHYFHREYLHQEGTNVPSQDSCSNTEDIFCDSETDMNEMEIKVSSAPMSEEDNDPSNMEDYKGTVKPSSQVSLNDDIKQCIEDSSNQIDNIEDKGNNEDEINRSKDKSREGTNLPSQYACSNTEDIFCDSETDMNEMEIKVSSAPMSEEDNDSSNMEDNEGTVKPSSQVSLNDDIKQFIEDSSIQIYNIEGKGNNENEINKSEDIKPVEREEMKDQLRNDDKKCKETKNIKSDEFTMGKNNQLKNGKKYSKLKNERGWFWYTIILPIYLLSLLFNVTVSKVLRLILKNNLNAHRDRLASFFKNKYGFVDKFIKIKFLNNLLTGAVNVCRMVAGQSIKDIWFLSLLIIEASTGLLNDYIWCDPKTDKPVIMSELRKDEPSPLKNTEETCYMNSMLQALVSSPRLIEQLEDLSKSYPANEMLQQFIDLLKDISGTFGHETVDTVTNKLVAFIRTVHWNRTSQQDAFQLLSFFINAIQNKTKIMQIMPPKFKILHAFSQDARYNKIQDHLALALPLCGSFSEKPGVSITSLFDAFFEPSLIDDGPNTTTMYLSEIVPDVMIVHIQANEWSNDKGAYIKPTYFIIYEEILEYTFKVYKEGDKSKLENIDAKYRLMAVVRHMGDVSGGHYITYRRCGQDWYLTNDEQVERVNFDKNIVPYIMVYEKIHGRV